MTQRVTAPLRLGVLMIALVALSACGAGNFLEWPKTATVPDRDWAEQAGLERLSVAHPTLEDTTISYVRAGDPAGQRVIFVHGSPGSSSTYRRYLLDVPEGFEFITIDRPGFGFTTPVKSVSDLTAQAASIEGLLDAPNGEPVILVGWSYGGPVIAQAAADYGDKIKGVVYLSSGLDPELEKVRFVQSLGNLWPFSRFVEDGWRIANEELIPLKGELEELAPKLASIKAPSVILHGEEDDLVPFENVAYAEANLTGVTDLHIESYPGYSHSIPFTKYGRVTAAIERLAAGYASEPALTTTELVDGVIAGDVGPLDTRIGAAWFAGEKEALAPLFDLAARADSDVCLLDDRLYHLKLHLDFLSAQEDEGLYAHEVGRADDGYDVIDEALMRAVDEAIIEDTAFSKTITERAATTAVNREFVRVARDNGFRDQFKTDAGFDLLLGLNAARECRVRADNRAWTLATLRDPDWAALSAGTLRLDHAAATLIRDAGDADLLKSAIAYYASKKDEDGYDTRHQSLVEALEALESE